MSRGKKLIILLICLVVAIIGTVLTLHFLGESKESSQMIVISEYDSASLEKIKWVYNGEMVELIKSDSKWQYSNDENFPLSDTKLTEILSSVSSIKAVRRLTEAPEEIQTYGINNPTLRLYVTANGSEHEYDIGSFNEASGYYYMMHTGDSALYYADSSLYTVFSVGAMDLVEFEFIPTVDKNNINFACINHGGSTIEIEPSEGKFIVRGSNEICQLDTVEKMIDSFVNIVWDKCVAYNVTDEDLAKYGLNEPTASFTLDYRYAASGETASGEEEATLNGNDTLLIGSATDDGKYYAKILDGNNIYTITEEIAKLYFVSLEESLYSKDLFTINSEDIKSITVTKDDKSITATTYENLDNESTVGYKVGDKDIYLESFVVSLLSLKAQRVQKSDIASYGQLLFSAKIELWSESISVSVYEYDDDYCAVAINDRIRYFADEHECDDIEQYLENALEKF